jgi:predicted Fe-Mo cluster-binding NifX family protein
MLIAVPSDTSEGLDSTISEHFGHCGAFTLVHVENNEIGEVSIVENATADEIAHNHAH